MRQATDSVHRCRRRWRTTARWMLCGYWESWPAPKAATVLERLHTRLSQAGPAKT